MASSTTSTKKMKKKPLKRLVKPATRSSSKQFESDEAEVNALVRGLDSHLKENVKDEDIPQHTREQLRAELMSISQDTSEENTTVGKTLPRLRDTSRTTNMPGATKTLKGVWLYSEEVRELGKEEPPNLESLESQPPQAPNLLESTEGSQESDKDISKELTTVGKTLPRLRDTRKITNMPGAIKTLKGAWLCSEERRELGKEDPPNLAPPEQSQSPQSPNCLESPEASPQIQIKLTPQIQIELTPQTQVETVMEADDETTLDPTPHAKCIRSNLPTNRCPTSKLN